MYQATPNKSYYHPPGQQMPADQNLPTYQNLPPNQNCPSRGQQMPANQNYSALAPPKSPQQYGAQHQYAQPSHQQQYAQPGRQMPFPIYQQQLPPQPMPYQYYPQNTGPQYNPVIAPPFQAMPLQQWSSTLFDCMDDPENCLITACFPCVTFGQIVEITDHGMTSCATSGLIYVLLLFFTGFHCLYSCMYRQKLRAQYSLAENPLPDILAHAFCEPCALCQEYRELKSRGFNMQIGWTQNKQMQGQVAAAPGVYVPPPVQTMGK